MSIFGFIEDVTGITADREKVRQQNTLAQEQRDEIQRRLDTQARTRAIERNLRGVGAGAAMLSRPVSGAQLLAPVAPPSLSAPPATPPGGLNARPTPAPNFNRSPLLGR
jgi:hypothetical protein